ncbi:MAG: hypothetical protein IK001_01840 [Lachnospiraceae bacterium]|nr:hypothetical protein [Lachnospiraceae bacterium]
MYIFIVMLLSLTTLGMFGCHKKDNKPGQDPKANTDKDTYISPTPAEDEPIDGGVTDRTDYSASKEIKSKDITEYYFNFCIEGKWAPGYENDYYAFEIKPDADGKMIASEETTGVAAEADKELLDAIQAVIDEYNIVSMNGEYRLTAGLDPAFFGPSTLRVNYASGEKLTFTHDNEPDAEWVIKTYLVFAKWFAGKGERKLLPEDYESRVTGVKLYFDDTRAGKKYCYEIGEERDKYGRLTASRTVDGKTESAAIFSNEIVFGSISRTVANYDLQEFEGTSYEGENALLQIEIKFEDGHEFKLSTSDESVIDEAIMLISDLIGEFDPLFR